MSVNKAIKIGKMDRKKLKAIELALVTILSCFASCTIKKHTSYKGTLEKPGRECFLDHASRLLITGRFLINSSISAFVGIFKSEAF